MNSDKICNIYDKINFTVKLYIFYNTYKQLLKHISKKSY